MAAGVAGILVKVWFRCRHVVAVELAATLRLGLLVLLYDKQLCAGGAYSQRFAVVARRVSARTEPEFAAWVEPSS